MSVFFVFVIIQLDAEKRTHEKILQKFVELIHKTNNKKKVLPKQQPKQDNILIFKDLGRANPIALSSTNYSKETQKNFALSGYQKKKNDEKQRSDSLWLTKRRHFYNWSDRRSAIEFSSLKDAKNFTLRFLLKKAKHEFYTSTNAVKLEPLQQFSQVRLDPANSELEQLFIQTEQRAEPVDEIIDDESEQILQSISVERVEDEQEQSLQSISVERQEAVEEPKQALPMIPINEQVIEGPIVVPIEDDAVQVNPVEQATEQVGDDQEQPLQPIFIVNHALEVIKISEEQHEEKRSPIMATNAHISIMTDLPLLESPYQLSSEYPTIPGVGNASQTQPIDDFNPQKMEMFRASSAPNAYKSIMADLPLLEDPNALSGEYPTIPGIGSASQAQPTDDFNPQRIERLPTGNNTGNGSSNMRKKRKRCCGFCSIQ